MLAKSVYVLCVWKKFAACFYYDVHVIYQPGHVTVCETVTKNESNFFVFMHTSCYEYEFVSKAFK